MQGFKKFILRGNVIDLAVGVMIGAAFNSVVTSLVTNIFTPLIGAIIKTPDFSNLAFTINGSKFMYGNFLNALISFIIVAAVVYFFVVTPINKLIEKTRNEESPYPTTKKCPECISEIPIKARKCAHCASVLEV